MTELVHYDAAIRELALAERVDEAKDVRDKAAALTLYYRQAGNYEAERMAANIRLRAERRVGELLKELARADTDANLKRGPISRDGTPGANVCCGESFDAPVWHCPNCSHHWTTDRDECGNCHADRPAAPKSPFAEALSSNGISRQDASRFQALAEVPESDFELALAEPTSLRGIIARNKVRAASEAPEPVDWSADSLRFWGWLCKAERDGILDLEPPTILRGMSPPMVDDLVRLAPLAVAFLSYLHTLAKESRHAEAKEPADAS